MVFVAYFLPTRNDKIVTFRHNNQTIYNVLSQRLCSILFLFNFKTATTVFDYPLKYIIYLQKVSTCQHHVDYVRVFFYFKYDKTTTKG